MALDSQLPCVQLKHTLLILYQLYFLCCSIIPIFCFVNSNSLRPSYIPHCLLVRSLLWYPHLLYWHTWSEIYMANRITRQHMFYLLIIAHLFTNFDSIENIYTHTSPHLLHRPSHYTDSISQEICIQLCSALFCCGHTVILYRFPWFMNTQPSWLLRWHWGNRMIAPVPVN